MIETEDRVVADDGVGLWVARSRGEGQLPVVFCHGGPGLWDQHEPVAAMIDDLADVVRWDQRGAGRSDHAGPYSVARCIDDLECVRRHHSIDRWVVIGHSWGAGLALRYALACPDRVTGLVYMSGTDLGWSDHRHLYRAERLRRLGSRAPRWHELRELPSRSPDEERELNLLTFGTDFADQKKALDLAARWGYDRFVINDDANAAINNELIAEDAGELEARCRVLTTAALIAHGSDDPRPIDGPRRLAEVLPNAKLAVLESVGHVPWAERPETLETLLRSFLISVGASDGRPRVGEGTQLPK